MTDDTIETAECDACGAEVELREGEFVFCADCGALISTDAE